MKKMPWINMNACTLWYLQCFTWKTNQSVRWKLPYDTDKIHQSFFYIGFPVEYASNATLYPPAKWMTTLIQRMNSDACINVKIFIVKLILKCSSILEPYCNLFIVPMIKVMVQYMKSESTSNRTSKIDQFVIDSLATLLSWNCAEPSKVSWMIYFGIGIIKCMLSRQ